MCQHHCPLPRRYLVLSWSSSSVSLSSVSLSSVSCRGHSCAPGAIMDPSVTAAPLTARPFTTSNYSGAPTPDSAVHFPHIRQSLNKTKAQLSLHFWWKQNTQAPGLFILLPGSFCLVRILDVVIQRRREEIREGGGGGRRRRRRRRRRWKKKKKKIMQKEKEEEEEGRGVWATEKEDRNGWGNKKTIVSPVY